MAAKQKSQPSELMVVNDAPGDECRIAILEDGHLEELYTERVSHATSVGNIYKGRVNNVEPAIQAAFIDYGKGTNGFLHVSDLHPRYFPGRDRTESVGKKIPRRERPLIQEALRRGDEVLVQVLKEGVGTKGPTLTSYLSIPGRLIVAMPGMDRVGVSRKVEDEEQRREMRRVLDAVELPEGFGFILRTAGIGRSKTELKRDVAYLMRLWKVMEKRRQTVPAPCELYTESDLLLRTVRDVLRPAIEAIIVDSASAHKRVTSFLRVVAPRSAPKVVRYRRTTPIFHAFDIERQIEMIHSREVPLLSGGHLVFEQTEALVAIDVNSGRSRAARDSETNAYHTNCEAVDEICRQLRLRDLGGLIINDLIDMRMMKHRRMIEERFRNNLKRDRARSTILRISEFGLIEMTRQRMRPSLRKSHFIACPTCRGHGEIQSPESVASDVTRQVGYLLDQNKVRRVEIVCSPRVASVLLSRKRRELVLLEDSSAKRVDVRVSDDIAADRIDYYAYDPQNADIDIRQLPTSKVPVIRDLEAEDEKAAREKPPLPQVEPEEESDLLLDEDLEDLEDEETAEETTEERKPRRRSRRRRRDRPGEKPEGLEAQPSEKQEQPSGDRVATDGQAAAQAGEAGGGRRRRRRRRRRADGSGAGVDGQAARAIGTGEPDPAGSVEGASDGEPVFEPAVEQDAASPAGRRPGDDPSSAAPPRHEVEEGPRGKGISMRIHQLAKDLNVSSREVLERCEAADGINVSTHMSSVTPQEADLIRSMFAGDEASAGAVAGAAQPGVNDGSTEGPAEPGGSGEATADEARKSRRRRRGGRRRGGRERRPEGGGPDPAATEEVPIAAAKPPDSPEQAKPRRKKRRSRRSGKNEVAAGAEIAGARPGAEPEGRESPSPSLSEVQPDGGTAAGGKKRKKRRRRGAAESEAGKKESASVESKPALKAESAGEDEKGSSNGKAKAVKRRALYRNRRNLSGLPRAGDDRMQEDER